MLAASVENNADMLVLPVLFRQTQKLDGTFVDSAHSMRQQSHTQTSLHLAEKGEDVFDFRHDPRLEIRQFKCSVKVGTRSESFGKRDELFILEVLQVHLRATVGVDSVT